MGYQGKVLIMGRVLSHQYPRLVKVGQNYGTLKLRKMGTFLLNWDENFYHIENFVKRHAVGKKIMLLQNYLHMGNITFNSNKSFWALEEA